MLFGQVSRSSARRGGQQGGAYLGVVWCQRLLITWLDNGNLIAQVIFEEVGASQPLNSPFRLLHQQTILQTHRMPLHNIACQFTKLTLWTRNSLEQMYRDAVSGEQGMKQL